MSPSVPENSENPAVRMVASEMFSRMLASVDPRDLGRRLTLELRELTGARTALLFARHAESEAYDLIHVSPDRRAAQFPPDEAAFLLPQNTPDPLPRLTAEMSADGPLRAMLAAAGVESLLRFPLVVSGELVGVLLLLDLPGLNRIGEVAEFISQLSAPIALALRNSLAFEQIERQRAEIRKYADELEQRVEKRTAELAAANEDLSASRRAALNMMEDAVEARNSAERMNAALRCEVDERTRAEESLRRSTQFTEMLNRISRSFLTHTVDEDMYDDVLRIVLEVMESPLGIFGYLDRQGDLVCPSMTRDVWDRCAMSNKTMVFPRDTWGSGIWGHSLQTGTPRYANRQLTVPEGHLAIERCLTVPLLFHERPIGILVVANNRRDYTDDDLDLLTRIGEHIAPVLNAMLSRQWSEEERERLQDRLLQSQKLEAIGQLAGGVAHDFNNLLSIIVGYGNMLMLNMPPESPSREYVDQMLAASERAAGLTQSLLAFSRKQVSNPRDIDLNASVQKVHKLLARIIGEDIGVKISLSREPLIIRADAIQLEQILMNLATNARDAMPDGGVLRIDTVLADRDALLEHSLRGPGEVSPYAVLSVTDTGTGMDKETQAKIFDPFFTTKEVGHGTGLGLAIVYGVVKQNNGHINVYSAVGKGTTFRIYFPLVTASAEAPADRGAQEAIRGGTETILIAEDDRPIRDLMRKALSEYGYRIIEAEDGEDALKKFQEHRETIRLVITDVIMPKKNGCDFFEEARTQQPDIKVIFMSGYPSDLIERVGVLEKGVRFLAKPASPQALLREVRAALDRSAR